MVVLMRTLAFVQDHKTHWVPGHGRDADQQRLTRSQRKQPDRLSVR